ncbi:MAG: SPOR domain-containing protein, partial [Luteimonas sp.]
AVATPVAPKPVEAAKPVAQTVATPAAANVGFAVQLGAFSKAADANALRDRVRAAGMSAFTEEVKTDKGTLTRVRVGPVASRADAEQLKAQVRTKIGVDGIVRPHP